LLAVEQVTAEALIRLECCLAPRFNVELHQFQLVPKIL
jgi:hypothetical protein